MKNKNDECFCEVCDHEKASQCIEIICKCCLQADKIRLGHLVFGGEERDEEREKTDDERYWEARAAAEASDIGAMIG